MSSNCMLALKKFNFRYVHSSVVVHIQKNFHVQNVLYAVAIDCCMCCLCLISSKSCLGRKMVIFCV
uniref:Uncharacterized protein n=1 Tax=Arundo donax TaxID=35708 RepID=A0A0A9C0U6_ARUDO